MQDSAVSKIIFKQPSLASTMAVAENNVFLQKYGLSKGKEMVFGLHFLCIPEAIVIKVVRFSPMKSLLRNTNTLLQPNQHTISLF